MFFGYQISLIPVYTFANTRVRKRKPTCLDSCQRGTILIKILLESMWLSCDFCLVASIRDCFSSHLFLEISSRAQQIDTYEPTEHIEVGAESLQGYILVTQHCHNTRAHTRAHTTRHSHWSTLDAHWPPSPTCRIASPRYS